MQCVTDSDCHAVGLLDGMCVENVCRPATSATVGNQASATQTTAGVPSAGPGGATANEGMSGTPSGGARSPEAPRAGDSVRPATRGTARNPDEDGGTGGVPVENAGAAGSGATSGGPATNCAGGKCECTADPDCIALGIAGGTCVEGQCWKPQTQCETDDECTSRGPEFIGGRCQDKLCQPNPRFRCEPPPPASDTDTRELILRVIDALQQSPLNNVPILACNKLDLTCMTPMAQASTGMDGKAHLMVPATFAGYMQSTERSDYVNAMYFMPALLPENGELSNFPLIPSAAFSGLGLALGAQTDRERGHAMLIVEDCKGAALAGITFTSPQADAKTTAFYVRDQIPTTSAKDTPPEGDGGYVNLPPGVVEITASDVKTGLVINTVTVLIRAGTVTTAYIRPASRGVKFTGRPMLIP
ncbi:MAG TPA: hypothetical protein VFN67_05310 [Polyangiales bacterium]|nr:hypothetical protein [Polyangiales bacterium]